MDKKDYSAALGSAVRNARNKLGLSQSEAAEKAEIGVETIVNIENNRGNPTFKIMYSVIQALNIDPIEIFGFKGRDMDSSLSKMELLLEDCSESETEILLSVCESLIAELRSSFKTKF